MSGQKTLSLTIDPSGAKRGAKEVVTAVKSIDKQLDAVVAKIDKMNAAFAKLNSTTAKSPEAAFKKLNATVNSTLTATDKLTTSVASTTKATDKLTASTNSADAAAKKLSNSIEFWTQRTKDLNSEEGKRLITLRESARQMESYQRSLVDALTPAQKMAKAEKELKDSLESVRRQAELLQTSYGKQNVEEREMLSLNKQLLQSEVRLSDAYQEQYAKLVKNREELARRKKEILGATKATDDLNKRTRTLTEGFNTLGGILAGTSLSLFVYDLGRTADAYKNLQNRIAVVTGSTEGMEQTTRDLLKVAQDSRSSLEATADVYAKISRVNKQYNKTQEELLTITTAVSQAVSMSGATVQGAEGAMIQFAQALQNNFAAAAQEMNSLIEQTPALAELVADAMNAVDQTGEYSIANIKRMATDGKIEVEKVLEGILLVSDEYAHRFELSQVLISQGWQQVKNALTVYLGELDAAAGATSALSGLLIDVSKNMDDYALAVSAVAGAFATLAAVTTGAAFKAIFALAGISAPIVAGIVAIGAALGVAVYAAIEFKDEIVAAFEDVELKLYEVLNMDFGSILDGITSAISSAVSKVWDFLTGGFDVVRDVIDSVMEYIADKFEGSILQSALKTMMMRFELVGKQIKLVFAEAWVNVLEKFEGMVNSIIWGLNKTIQEAVYKINQLRSALGQGALTVDAITPISITNDARKSVDELRTSIEQLSGEILTQADATDKLIKSEREDLELKRQIAEWASFAGGSGQDGDGGTVGGNTPKGVNKLADAFERLREELDPVYKAEKEYREDLALLNTVLDKTSPLYDKLKTALDKSYKAFLKNNDPLEKQKGLFEDITKELKLEQSQIGKTERQLYIFERTQRLVNQAKEDGVEVNSEYIKALELEAGKTYDLIKADEEYRNSLEKQQQELENLRDTIADTFMDGFEAAMEGGEEFKDWFDDLLKELALMAIRNQIVIPIVGNMVGITGQTSAAGGMLQQVASSPSGGQGGGGMNIMSTVSNLFGGYSYGTAVSNFGGWVGGSSPIAGTGVGNYISGVSANAANYANWTYGLTGFAGGALANLAGLSGEYSDVLGAIGAAIGSVFGPAGSGIGSFLGSTFGGLFGGDKGYRERGSMGSTSEDRGEKWLVPDAMDGEEIRVETPFGWTHININKYGDVSKFQPLLDQIEVMDFLLASSIQDTGKIKEAKQSIDNWRRGGGRGDQNNIYTYTEERYSILLEALDNELKDWVYGATEDLGDRVQTFSTISALGENTPDNLNIYRSLQKEGEMLSSSIIRTELQKDLVEAMFDMSGEDLESRIKELMSTSANVFSYVVEGLEEGFKTEQGGLAEFTRVFADNWVEEFVMPLLNSGEELTEGFGRLLTQFSVVSSYAQIFDHNLGNTTNGILKASDNIVKFSGGIESFNAAASSYYQNFYSEEERFEHLSENLANVFKDLGLELPTTTQGFRDLVEGLDLTKEADQELYATLLKLNPQVKQYIEGLEQVGNHFDQMVDDLTGLLGELEQAIDAEKDAISALVDARIAALNVERGVLEEQAAAANAYFQERIGAEQEYLSDIRDAFSELSATIRDEISSVSDRIRDLTDVSEELASIIDTLAPSTKSYARNLYEIGRAQVAALFSTGGIPTIDQLDGIQKNLSGVDPSMFSTEADYLRSTQTTANQASVLLGKVEDQLSVEEEALALLQLQLDQATSKYNADVKASELLIEQLQMDQEITNEYFESQIALLDEQIAKEERYRESEFARLDAIYAAAVAEVNAVLGVDRSIQSVTSALNAIYTQINNDPIISAYRTFFGRNPEEAGYNYWSQQVLLGNISQESLAEYILGAARGEDRSAATIRGFASGGTHYGGLRIVGENGPELEATGPSRIINNDRLKQMVSQSANGDSTKEEIAKMRADLMAGLRAIEKNTREIKQIEQRWDRQGLPEERDFA